MLSSSILELYKLERSTYMNQMTWYWTRIC